MDFLFYLWNPLLSCGNYLKQFHKNATVEYSDPHFFCYNRKYEHDLEVIFPTHSVVVKRRGDLLRPDILDKPV